MICDLSNDKTYLIMKSVAGGDQAYIEFTVNGAATLLATVTSTSRVNNSEYILVDANGNPVAERFNVTSVTGVSGYTLVYEIEEAGTYRFICTSTNRVGRLMIMKLSSAIVK